MANRMLQSPTTAPPAPADGASRSVSGQCPADSDTELMRLQFGLSPRQAKLTALLLSGRSLKEAADVLGITEGSARQYLKGIFRKTGARRQADLVRIVLNALALSA
jgi:DNA-binding CsgD family transcriptional regulator